MCPMSTLIPFCRLTSKEQGRDTLCSFTKFKHYSGWNKESTLEACLNIVTYDIATQMDIIVVREQKKIFKKKLQSFEVFILNCKYSFTSETYQAIKNQLPIT